MNLTETVEIDELRERVAHLEAENAALRQLEDSLRRNTRLFEAVVTRCREGIVLVTPQLTFLRLIHSVIGNSDRELVGQSILTVIHPDDAAVASSALERVAAGEARSLVCEFRVADKNGGYRWLEAEITDMLDDPDVQAIVLNSRDISYRRQ